MPKLTLKKYHGNYYDLYTPDGRFAGKIEIIDGGIESFFFTPEYARNRNLAEMLTETRSLMCDEKRLSRPTYH